MAIPLKKDINNTPLQAEILKRNRKNAKKQKLLSTAKKGAKYLLILFLIFAIIFAFLKIPFFNISNVEINSLEYINQEEVKTQSSGILGKNFFLVDLESLRTELLKKYSFIDTIYTEKIFPSKVIITINERKPSLVIDTSRDCVLLDNKGFVINISPRVADSCADKKSEYSVVILSGKDVNLDFQQNTYSSFYFLDKISVVKNVVEYYGYQIDNFILEDQVLTVNLFDGKTIMVSFSQDLDTQLKRLIIITGEMSTANMKFRKIDLRYERPVVTQ